MTFKQVVMFCYDQPDFVREWSRLRGVSFSKTPIDLMIDKATGYQAKVMRMFIEDVKDLVWDRIGPEARNV